MNGTFSLATCGWVLGPLGDRLLCLSNNIICHNSQIRNRALLDSVLPDDYTLSSIDMNVGWDPVDPAYANVTHHQKWVIPWMEDDPGLTAIELWVNRTLEHGLSALQCI